MPHAIRWICLLLLSLVSACRSPAGPPQALEYDLLREAPHDRRLFTQGLLIQDDLLVETSGGYGQSLVRRYRIDDGQLVNETRLPPDVFAEGIAQVEDELLVLTWRAGRLFRFDATTLAPKAQMSYDGEGWGLAYDGNQLFMSDGSNRITIRDPENFSRTEQLVVTDGERTWDQLNELEYAQGLLWANRWRDHRIFAIDPETGQVLGILDLGEFVARNNRSPGHTVLNGIAYDPAQDAFWVTGKLWPHRYLVRVRWPGNRPD